ncbi:MAG: leucine--tRNA ligase [bacterium]|nr:leucine--tRNA ligase [bacterium]
MATSYNHKKIETKWQKRWRTGRFFEAHDMVKDKKNFYHLVMFPYPSGDLHIGHWYNFAPADTYARFKRMEGYNVMSPIGFDSFGLPAENAALKRGIHPEKWTLGNIKTMTKQLEAMGNSYDWSRLVITCMPEYYKWNQWIFLKLFEKGLAYRKKAAANWCPSCKTVLANEQVVNGKCERCASEVEQKEIDQWLLKITHYAERLIEDLISVDWPERTKLMQEHWIGRSEGSELEFPVANSNLKVTVFTTRADTLPGATYIVLAPEHPLITILEERILNKNSVKEYIERARHKSELERISETKTKSGVELHGIKVINPFTKKEIPVWVSDYVLAHYGTGAIMAVPAHDDRDFAFAKEFNLPIVPVISADGKAAPKEGEPRPGAGREVGELQNAYTGDGIMAHVEEFNGLPNHIAKDRITEKVSGKKKINYRFRDWLISRQRYWGTPIPIIYCTKCGTVPVPEKDLPVTLPRLKDFTPDDTGRSPLAKSKKFFVAQCPQCGGDAERETDTMDTFVDSSWYFMRYTDPHNSQVFADDKKIKSWLPVTMYIGGAEHAVLHLLYARFFTKFLYDEGLIDFKEPFKALRHQGIILGSDGQKMSKSRGNVIDPDKLVAEFGADSVRLYLSFMTEYQQGGPWNPTGILGVHRFLQRVWNLGKGIIKKGTSEPAHSPLLHKTIKKVGEDITALKFNTAVSALMILLNAFEKEKEKVTRPAFEDFLLLLAPFAPHMTDELWEALGHKQSIHQEQWPQYDAKAVIDDTVEFLVQINGKLRDKIMVSRNISQGDAEKLVFERDAVKELIGAKKPKNIIFVEGRLINIVI